MSIVSQESTSLEMPLTEPQVSTDNPHIDIRVSPEAQSYFKKLLAEETDVESHLRIFVTEAGTPKADVSIVFCGAGEEHPSDLCLALEDFNLFIDHASLHALKEAFIDFKTEGMGGELCIKAPHLKILPAFSSLKEKIQYVIDREISPGLAAHGGFVQIVDLLESGILILQFGGGCHGCGMAQMTMKQGIERVLKERFPEIVAVQDATDHEQGTNPYC